MKLLTMAMFVLIVNVIGTFGDQCTTNCAFQALRCARHCSWTDIWKMLICYNSCTFKCIYCNVDCPKPSRRFCRF